MDVYGIDVGYGFTKIVTATGRRASFPSVCKLSAGDGLAEVFGPAAADHRLRLMTPGTGFREWLVGRAALAADAVRSWSSSGSGRTDYPVLVMAALAAVGARGRVGIAVGLPLSVYLIKTERLALQASLRGLGGLVGLGGREPVEIEIASAVVYPQAVGAYLTWAASVSGMTFGQQAVGLVDVGYRTTDYLLMRSLAPDTELSGSIDLGIGGAMTAVAQNLAETHGLAFALPDTAIEEALLGDGSIGIRGQVVDLRPDYRERVEQLGLEITERLRHVWAKRLDRLAAIILSGGGGAAVQPFIGLPGAVLAEDPVYANANGFMRMARMRLSESLSDTANPFQERTAGV